jgi:adenylate kinase family enzyme
MTLDALGPRLCILGPSNSGKSTLAVAIARARDLPPVHLDQLHHLPNTDWQPRAPAEFVALHDRAIGAERWVMEGNYTRLLPQRLARATGLILLDLPAATSLVRYVRRCWFETDRLGALEGGRDSVKWAMLHHIAIVSPGNRRRYRTIFDQALLPKVALLSPRALADFYRAERLAR